jgi:hypothetical protein
MDISGTPTQQQGGKMYKKQLKLQKILCFLAIASSVVIFLYALGIMTDLYDTLYSTMKNPANLSETDVPGSIVYYNMQAFNSYFLRESIVLMLIACLLFLTNTQVRRRYYIGNYVAIGLFAAANIGLAVWAHGYIEVFKQQFQMVDFEALRKHAEMWKTAYVDSTFWFDAHYAVYAVLLIVTVLLVLNLIWKIRLMKAEQRLLAAGKEAMA